MSTNFHNMCTCSGYSSPVLFGTKSKWVEVSYPVIIDGLVDLSVAELHSFETFSLCALHSSAYQYIMSTDILVRSQMTMCV